MAIELGTDVEQQQGVEQPQIELAKRELIDRETGEINQVDEISQTLKSVDSFWKVYLSNFLFALGIFDNRQVDVFIYMWKHTNPSDNLFIGTYRKIAEDVGCSTATVRVIMKKMQDKGFITKVQNGVYLLSPRLTMRGNDRKKQILLSFELDAQAENERRMQIKQGMRQEIPHTTGEDADTTIVLPPEHNLPSGEKDE